VLDEMVNQYNNTFHSSIKMTPVQASEKKNEATVYRNLYGFGEDIKHQSLLSVTGYESQRKSRVIRG